MENSCFKIGRFRKYFVHDFLRCIKKAGLATLLCSLVPVFTLLMSAWIFNLAGIHDWHTDPVINEAIAAVVSILYFLLLPIACYGELTDKRKGTQYLMLPASHLEKWTGMTLNSIIILPLIFSALYIGTDALCSVLFPQCHYAITGSRTNGLIVFFLPTMVSAAGLAGAMLFKNRKGSKTFITCVVSFIVFCIIIIKISEMTDFGYTAKKMEWYIFQAFCTLCLLAYTYFKTKKIEL